MKVVEEKKTRKLLEDLIDHRLADINAWLFKLGYTKEERKAFWLRQAEEVTDEFKSREKKKLPLPVEVVLESGEGLGRIPGAILWRRPYPIDLMKGLFPFDFPINQAQLAEFRKQGFIPTLYPDGTGLGFTSDSEPRGKQETINAIEASFNFYPTIIERGQIGERKKYKEK